jgi:exonuclease III
LQEVKIARRDEVMKRRVERAANFTEAEKGEEDDGPRYEVHFALPRDRYNATGWGGKVHGVATLLREDIPSLFGKGNGIGSKVVTRDVEWDREGRIRITEFESWDLVVVNGYWPNGTMNAWKDSSSGVVRGTRHDFKRRFHELMLEEVKEYEKRGWAAVLVGDMNIARSAIDGYPGIRLGSEHVKNRKDFNWKFMNMRIKRA